MIMRSEVLHGRPWLEHPVKVVADDGDQLAVLLEPGSRFTFPDHPFGTHPWSQHAGWSGPTVLQLHRAGTPYSVWKFFDEGRFRGWYVNFEEPFTRTATGFHLLDHGLDLEISPDGTRRWVDVEDLDAYRRSGRLDDAGVLAVLTAAREVWELIERDDRWWSGWDSWAPPRA